MYTGCIFLALLFAHMCLHFRELGVHVDGFIAVVGHTAVVGAKKVCNSEMFAFYVHYVPLVALVRADYI